MLIEGHRDFGEPHIYVDGVTLTPDLSQHVLNRSPDGFEWGYGGSGPAQLALALLLAARLKPISAIYYHQRFLYDHVARWSRPAFSVTVDVPAWVATQRPPARVTTS